MQLLSVTLFLASIFLASAVDRQYISANGTFANRRDYDLISVKNGGHWGVWTWIDKCPPGSYAIGFSIRVEEYRGASDDTSLNGIRLFCSTEQTSNIMYTVESEPGDTLGKKIDVSEIDVMEKSHGFVKYGHWSGIRWCPRNGILRSFQLKVEPEQGAGDDTAVNNIRFRCSNGLQIEEAGGSFGEYSEWSTPCERGGICGLQTKQEPYQGFFIDDTALNDVRFFCCE